MPDWQKGLIILAHHRASVSAVAMDMIERHGNNSFTRDLMREEIEKLKGEPHPVLPPTTGKQESWKLPYSEAWPQQVKEIRQQAINHMKAQDNLRGQLRYVALNKRDSDLKRKHLYEIAKQIIDLEKPLQGNYNDLWHYHRTGSMPAKEEVRPLEERQKLIYWLSVQIEFANYVRKYRNDTKRADEVERRRKVLDEINEFTTICNQGRKRSEVLRR